MLGEETSRTPPSRPFSRLKLLRKLSWAKAEVTVRPGVSRRLSLIVTGSSTNASLGAVSGVRFEVTQSGAGPAAFVADQPAGKAGATTLSKFSLKGVPEHGVCVG